jgi:23S rRNA pseudouridine2605 synthase
MKRKTDNFSKFYNKKNNAAIKEEFRQEKKAAKKERKEAIERHFEEKRKAREQQFPLGKSGKPGFASRAGANVPPGRGSSNVPIGKVPSTVPPGKGPHVVPAKGTANVSPGPDALPLNKYIAHGGICSRRDAAELIRLGKVTVNGQLVTEPGTKVSPNDLVKANGKTVTISRNFVYILLNKPKDYITTTDDPQGRKTVLDLIRQATPERVFPVGRLDRNTSGVLLLTNDGDLAQKLAHPKHEIKKIYHASLDKPLTKADFDAIASGVTLEDGIAYVDVIAYADAKDKTQIGLEIHSGRNRIVRRIFEHLGYDVKGLDRVTYAGLTKKNVQRGHWRMLTEKEIRILKYLNSSFRGSLAAPKAHKQEEGEGFDTPATSEPASAKGVAAKGAAPKDLAQKDPAYKGPAPKKFNRKGPGHGGPKKRRPEAAEPSNGPAKSPREDKKPPIANGGLRGRKSGGSYIKSKAKSQQESAKAHQSPGKSFQAPGKSFKGSGKPFQGSGKSRSASTNPPGSRPPRSSRPSGPSKSSGPSRPSKPSGRRPR